MGKLQEFEVLLSGDKEVFKPGDVLEGEARIVVSEEKRDIRGIKIKCVGKSFASWKETQEIGDNQIEVTYTSNHEFFREEITLNGTGNGNSAANRMTLTAGEHRYPFQFQIPNISLPPPFEGPYGFVRYYVKVAIDRPWKFDHRTQKLFSIATVKDLNYELDVLVPFSLQLEKTLCCLCCASGTVVLKGMIDKRGYVPGEYIFVSLDLQNNSSRRIKNIKAILYERGQYTGHRRGVCGVTTHHIESIKQVAKLKLAGCEAMGSVNYDRMKILIPPIPPCTYENCPNIQVKYSVEIMAGVSGTILDPIVSFPIVIGTIPAFQHTLMDPSQNPDAVQPIPGQPGAPPGGQPGFPPQGQQGYPPPGQHEAPPSGAGPSGYPRPGGVSSEEGLPPPPKYTAAVGGPYKIKSKRGRPTFGEILFTPQYPYYDPDTLYASMGIPLGATTSSTDGGQPPPTVMQPMSIQQPPHQT